MKLQMAQSAPFFVLTAQRRERIYRDIMPIYYNTVIKSKLARDDDSIEMLDLIREGIVVNMGSLIYDHIKNPLNSIGYYLADESNQFASFYEANVEIFKQYLTEVVNMHS